MDAQESKLKEIERKQDQILAYMSREKYDKWDVPKGGSVDVSHL